MMSKARQNDPVRRTALFHEQNGLCFYCTEPMLATPPHPRPRPPHEVTLEHLIPLSEGGRRGFHNEVAACNECNHRRGTAPWLLFYCLMELERAAVAQNPTPLFHPGSYPMTPLDIRAEVHGVIGGKQGGAPAIPFPHDPAAADLVVHTTRTFLDYAGALTEAQRVQFIRKFAHYITRTGWKAEDTTNHLAGLIWFAQRPEHLATRLGFGSAIQAQYEFFRHRQNSMRLLTEDEILDDLDETPVVSKPILLARGDFVLEQLVHAAHLVEVGLALNNCLKTKVGARILPDASYWTRIKRGHRQLFTVRHRERVCFLIEIGDRVITQAQFRTPPPELYAVLPAVAERLEHELGPIKPALHDQWWPLPKASPVVEDRRRLGLFRGDQT